VKLTWLFNFLASVPFSVLSFKLNPYFSGKSIHSMESIIPKSAPFNQTMKSKTFKNRNKKRQNLLYDHIVFHTKYNRPMLNKKIRSRAKEIICEVMDDLSCEVIEIDVLSNHVHLLFGFPPTLPPSKIVTKVKGILSRVLRQEFPILVKKCPKALWQVKGAHYSVGNEIKRVREYIRNQGPHHGYKP
jgi:putative transposase